MTISLFEGALLVSKDTRKDGCHTEPSRVTSTAGRCAATTASCSTMTPRCHAGERRQCRNAVPGLRGNLYGAGGDRLQQLHPGHGAAIAALSLGSGVLPTGNYSGSNTVNRSVGKGQVRKRETGVVVNYGNEDCLPAIWEVPDDLWARIRPVIEERHPDKSTGRRRADPGVSWTAPYSECAPTATGTVCPGNWEMIVRSTEPSTAECNRAC